MREIAQMTNSEIDAVSLKIKGMLLVRLKSMSYAFDGALVAYIFVIVSAKYDNFYACSSLLF